MVRGLELGPATRILDAGCGAGGFAIWCAERFGCRVTGITICSEHVELAARHASEAGVAERCEFRWMDMDALDFAPGSFDVVVNQETFCCARNKSRYLREVLRILAPGGAWSSIGHNLARGALSPPQEGELPEVVAGLPLPSVISPEPVVDPLPRGRLPDPALAEVASPIPAASEVVIAPCHQPLR